MILHITRICNNGDITYMGCASMDDEYRRFFDCTYYDLFYDIWRDEVHQEIGQGLLNNPPLYSNGLWYEYEVRLDGTHKTICIDFKNYIVVYSLK